MGVPWVASGCGESQAPMEKALVLAVKPATFVTPLVLGEEA